MAPVAPPPPGSASASYVLVLSPRRASNYGASYVAQINEY